MKAKHTPVNVDMQAAFSSILESAGDEALALVLNHLELSQRAVEWLMQRETTQLAGERYSHEKPHEGQFSRWGSNPGSVSIGGQKIPVEVPRIHDSETQSTRSPEVYTQLRQMSAPPEHIMRALLRGLGMRQYQEAAEMLMESFGLSKSTLSAAFVEYSGQILEEFLQRRLDDETYVAMFVDGKVMQNQSMVVAIGITEKGQKRTLGLTQATTENGAAIGVMFRDMIERGFEFEQGILVVIDGGKGLRKAVNDVFGDFAVVQRCQIHKLRNVLSHLGEQDQETMKRKLKALFACEDMNEARSMADEIHAALKRMNINAARSFLEGLDETLTLTRLNVPSALTKSFRTTNVIESVNSMVARYTRHITRWTTADQRMRWTAIALVEMEPNWNKVHKFRLLPMLQRLIQKEVNERTLELSSKQKPKRISTRNRT